MKTSYCSFCALNLAFIFYLLLLVSCGSSNPQTVDPNVTPNVPTPADHIKGVFSITQVTQVANNLTQAYSNTKVTIAVSGSALSFTVNNPPETSVISTGVATFDGQSKLVLTPDGGGNPIDMNLDPISEDGFTATFTIADVPNARRGVTGKWVMVFSKDK